MAMNGLGTAISIFSIIVEQVLKADKIKKEYELATEKVRSETRITLTQLRLDHERKMRAIEGKIKLFDKMLDNSDPVFCHKLIESCHFELMKKFEAYEKNHDPHILETCDRIMNMLDKYRSDLHQNFGLLMNEFSEYLALPDSQL